MIKDENMKKCFIFTLMCCCFLGSAFAESPAAKESGKIDMSKFPFAPLFAYSAAEIERVATASKEILDKKLETIIKIPAADRTFENTLLAFEFALNEYAETVNIPQFLAQVADSKELRESGSKLEEDSSAYMVEISTRRDLFKAVDEFARKKVNLATDEAFLLDRTLFDFKRNGLALPEKELEAFKDLKKQLVALELKFDKNTRDFKDQLEVTKEQLEGLSEDYLGKLKKTESGKFIISLDYPDYYPFMDNAKNEDARRQLEFKFNNRCASDNVQIMEEALLVREKMANMLGFKNHAQYMLEEKMANKPEIVLTFLDKLTKRLLPKGKVELQARLDLKTAETGKPAGDELPLWDWRYYNNQYRKKNFDIDQEKVKEYFPMEKVVSEMLKIFEELYDVKFLKADLPVWHPDVTAFELKENNGDLIGYCYMDLFPRDGKYKHMACFDLVKGRRLANGTYQKPSAAIVGNFPKPADKTPSLLNHGDVETMFHEFGHVLHNLFTKARFGSFSGTSIAQDFVESPSIMNENLVWSPAILKRLSAHYKNPTEKIPDEMVKKLIEGKNCDSGLVFLRQLLFSTFDMMIHTTTPKNTTETFKTLMKEIMLTPMTEGTHFQASFGHLMGGYDAGYYGYLWSRVISSDLFSEFEKNGIIDPKTGNKFREIILSTGKVPDQNVQVEKFLGRPFTEDAFMKDNGFTR